MKAVILICALIACSQAFFLQPGANYDGIQETTNGNGPFSSPDLTSFIQGTLTALRLSPEAASSACFSHSEAAAQIQYYVSWAAAVSS
mmetsp:Transcript_38806/g.34500  ORF Transcript_38806/g.34500 Transcript_38806/m.34500 type:complete len:88 (-) Transcript_38806:468-731(-)